MVSDEKDFEAQRLHFVDSSTREIVPGPGGETAHGSVPNYVVHFDVLYDVEESGRIGTDGLFEDPGFPNTFIKIYCLLSTLVWREPTDSYTPEVAVKKLLH